MLFPLLQHLFIICGIVSCYLNRAINACESNALTGLIPISPDCVVGWILESQTCGWCTPIFDNLITEFNQNYNPSIISDGIKLHFYPEKPNCFTAIFLSTKFHNLRNFVYWRNGYDFHSVIRFIILDYSKMKRFRSFWKLIIDQNFDYLFPKAVLMSLKAFHSTPTCKFKCFRQYLYT